MDGLQLKALLAGVVFGVWPLLMNRSGLNGNVATLVFVVVVLVGILPFSLGQLKEIANPNWIMAISAGALGAIGLLSFNSMLVSVTPKNVGALFVLMILIQATIPAIYNVVMNEGISFMKAMGFVLAGVSAFLLIKY